MVGLASRGSSPRRDVDLDFIRDRSSEAQKFGAHRNRRGSATRALIMPNGSIDERIERLHGGGVVDMHFDLPMDLYEKREQRNVLETHFLPEFKAGNISVVGVALYVDDHYLPDHGLRVALDQIA